ncbi:hypothetical protein SK128_009969 [Halocaridina rubra]|uniref:Uncharacterized protein n=1 Tax=Halocaridina rubra TaxID=373956 RepID=A0AAN9AHR2_HALRR
MPKNFDFSKSTGHVNSPAPIFIHKKNSVKTPKLYRKGRKAPMKTAPESIEDIDLEGLAELLNTPKSKEENMVLKTIGWPLRDIVSHFTPLSKAVRVREMLSKNKIASTPGTESDISSVSTLTPVGQRISDSSAYSPTMFSPVTPPNTSLSLDKTSTSACSPSHLDGTSFDFSSVKTPDVTEDNFISPLVTPTPSKTPVQRLLRSSQKSFVASPNISNIDSTTFDFDSAETPNVTQDIFISPMSTRSKPGTPRVESWNSVRVVLNDCRTESPLKLHREAQNSVTECSRPTKITRHSTEGSPRSEKIKGNTTETLRKSAKSVTAAVSEQSSRDSIGKSSPESDYANVLGVAKLLRTPKPSLADTEPDYIDVVGVKRLLRTPKPMVDESGSDVIDITELKKMFKTPKTSPGQQANYSNVEGVKILLKTPQMSPTQGADYADVVGTKKNVTTPKLSVDSPAADYSNVAGVRRLMKTPKESIVDHEPDYSDVAGVKKLLQTPLGLKSSPMADYTNVIGVRNLMRTPKEKVGEREADYAHITGIRKLLRTPKALVESPKGDYSNVAGLKKLLASPRVTHENEADYTNIAGVKKLMKTPIRVEKEREPPCDFTEVEGVKNLLRLPNNEIIADYSNPKGLRKLMATPKQNLNEPLSDYTNVAGIRKLMKTPRAVKSPQVDYTRVEGLRKLMKTPRASLSNSNIDFEGLTELLKSPVLSVNSANVVEQIMDLVSQTSTPSSLRKSKRIKRDQTPVSSSPSENVPPDTELKAVMNLLYQKDSKEINSPRRSKRNEKSTPVLDDTLRKTRSQKASDVGSPLPSKIKHDFESKKNVELGENNSSRSLSDNLPLENVITVVNLIGHGPSQEASGPRRSKRNEQSTPTVDDNPRNTRSRKVVKLESPFSSRQNCPANETESMELDERNLLRNDNVTPKDEPVTAIRLVSHEDLQEVSSPRRSKRNEKSSSKIDDPPRKTRSRKVVDTQSPVSNKRKQNAIVTEVSELNESPRKRTKTNNPDLTGIVIEGKGRHKGKKVKEHVINEDSKSVSNSVEKCSQNTVKSSKETGKTTSEEEILQDEDEYWLVKNQEETSGDSNNCMSDKFKKSVTYADKLEIVVSVEQKNQVEPSSAPVRRRGRRRHPVGEMKDDEALLSKSNTIQDSSKINVETEDLSPDNGRAKCCSVQDTKVESPKKRTQDEINENLSPAVQKGRSRRLKKIGEVNPALPEEKVDEEVEKSLPAVRRGKSRKVDEFLSEAISPPVTKRARSTRGRNSLKKEALEADSKSEKHMEISSGCQEGLPEETEALTCAEDKVQEAPSPKVRRGRRRKNSAAEICDSGAVMNKVTKNEKISSSVLIDNTTAGKAEKKNTKTTRSNKSQKENVNVEPDITCPSENDGEHLPSTEKASSRRTRAAPKAQSLTYEDVERKVSKISGRQTRGKKNSTENSAVTEPEKIEIGPTTRAKRGTRNINNQECVPESPGKVTRKTRSRK